MFLGFGSMSRVAFQVNKISVDSEISWNTLKSLDEVYIQMKFPWREILLQFVENILQCTRNNYGENISELFEIWSTFFYPLQKSKSVSTEN